MPKLDFRKDDSKVKESKNVGNPRRVPLAWTEARRSSLTALAPITVSAKPAPAAAAERKFVSRPRKKQLSHTPPHICLQRLGSSATGSSSPAPNNSNIPASATATGTPRHGSGRAWSGRRESLDEREYLELKRQYFADAGESESEFELHFPQVSGPPPPQPHGRGSASSIGMLLMPVCSGACLTCTCVGAAGSAFSMMEGCGESPDLLFDENMVLGREMASFREFKTPPLARVSAPVPMPTEPRASNPSSSGSPSPALVRFAGQRLFSLDPFIALLLTAVWPLGPGSQCTSVISCSPLKLSCVPPLNLTKILASPRSHGDEPLSSPDISRSQEIGSGNGGSAFQSLSARSSNSSSLTSSSESR